MAVSMVVVESLGVVMNVCECVSGSVSEREGGRVRES